MRGLRLLHLARPSLALYAALALLLPTVATALQPTRDPDAAARPIPGHFVPVQYDGMPFDGPGPYGPGPDGPGPYGPGPDGPGPEGPYGGFGGPRSQGPYNRHGRFVAYRGFRIDLTGGTSELAAVEHQIDIVDSVGLSASDLRFFRSLTVHTNGAEGGARSNGHAVSLGTLQGAENKPVLLHEYMHVLHASRLPGGFRNPTIRRFYEEAVANGLYPQGSYMMSNVREFFAVTASCYLYGTVERPPYTRDAIRSAQPDYYAYLQQLFGRSRRTIRASSSAPALAS